MKTPEGETNEKGRVIAFGNSVRKNSAMDGVESIAIVEQSGASLKKTLTENPAFKREEQLQTAAGKDITIKLDQRKQDLTDEDFDAIRDEGKRLHNLKGVDLHVTQMKTPDAQRLKMKHVESSGTEVFSTLESRKAFAGDETPAEPVKAERETKLAA